MGPRYVVTEGLTESRDPNIVAVIEHIGDPAVIVDLTGDIVYSNPRFSEMTGWASSEVMGRNPRLLQSGQTPREVYVALWTTITTGRVWSGTLLNKRKDGTKYWADLTIVPVRGRDGAVAGYVGIEGGRTERQSAERRHMARRAISLSRLTGGEEEAVIRAILQDICEAMRWKFGAYWVPRGAVLRCAACWSADPAAFRAFEEISRAIDFDPGRGLPGRVWQSGAPAWIEDVTRDTNFPRAPVARNVGLGAAFGFPVMIEGDFHGVLEFFNDAIERPDEELLELMGDAGRQMALWLARQEAERRERLRHSQRLVAVGQLAAGMAHELNNPLGIILGFAQAARRLVAEEAPLAQPLKSIERESLRCRDLVAKLLRFSSRQAERAFALVDIGAVVREAMELIEPRARAQSVAVALRLDLAEPVLAAGQELVEVVVNLCNNALDAMSEGGRLDVATRAEGAGGSRRAVLEVSDSGAGIPPEAQPRVFEPFFTTRETGKGSGLGLSIVHGIVERHEGAVSFRTSPGKGTTFSVRLPLPSAGTAREGT